MPLAVRQYHTGTGNFKREHHTCPPKSSRSYEQRKLHQNQHKACRSRKYRILCSQGSSQDRPFLQPIALQSIAHAVNWDKFSIPSAFLELVHGPNPLVNSRGRGPSSNEELSVLTYFVCLNQRLLLILSSCSATDLGPDPG